MRAAYLVGLLASFVCSAAWAQSCEVMTIKDASGQIVSSNMMCVDEDGAWADPATLSLASPSVQPAPPILEEPIVAAPLPVASPIPADLAPLPAPVTVDAAPLAAPVILEPVVVTAPATVLPVTKPARTTSGWQPTSGKAKRKALYAKLGLVCRARKAMFCGEVPCSGLCEGKQGWCDGKTGETHASLEAIERLYCRKKKRR